MQCLYVFSHFPCVSILHIFSGFGPFGCTCTTFLSFVHTCTLQMYGDTCVVFRHGRLDHIPVYTRDSFCFVFLHTNMDLPMCHVHVCVYVCMYVRTCVSRVLLLGTVRLST